MTTNPVATLFAATAIASLPARGRLQLVEDRGANPPPAPAFEFKSPTGASPATARRRLGHHDHDQELRLHRVRHRRRGSTGEGDQQRRRSPHRHRRLWQSLRRHHPARQDRHLHRTRRGRQLQVPLLLPLQHARDAHRLELATGRATAIKSAHAVARQAAHRGDLHVQKRTGAPAGGRPAHSSPDGTKQRPRGRRRCGSC